MRFIDVSKFRIPYRFSTKFQKSKIVKIRNIRFVELIFRRIFYLIFTRTYDFKRISKYLAHWPKSAGSRVTKVEVIQ